MLPANMNPIIGEDEFGKFCVVKGRLLRYNLEVRDKTGTTDFYFGPDYYVNGRTITKLNKNEVMLDYFVLDTQTGTVRNPSGTEDCACDIFNTIFKGKKIRITRNNKGEKYIYADDTKIATVSKGQITELVVPETIDIIGDKFLWFNRAMKSISFLGAKIIGDYCLDDNEVLKQISAKGNEQIGESFLSSNNAMTSISLPTRTIGPYFMPENKVLNTIDLPNLINLDHAGAYCFGGNNLVSVNIQKLDPSTQFVKWVMANVERNKTTMNNKTVSNRKSR